MSKKAREKVKGDVVVLHGLMMNRVFMSGISGYLKQRGFSVHALSYPSRTEFDSIVDGHLKPFLDAIPAKKIDFVVHSLGGILVRLYARKYGAARIGRVVMIGTPNHGSQVADFMGRWDIFHKYFGEVGPGLGTGAEDIHAKLPPVPFECGVIAGDNHWLRVMTNTFIDMPKPHDGIVSVESTKVPGMKEHVVVPGDHSQMVWSPKVWKLAAKFLETGTFGPAK